MGTGLLCSATRPTGLGVNAALYLALGRRAFELSENQTGAPLSIVGLD
jgi:hypothetical protein